MLARLIYKQTRLDPVLEAVVSDNQLALLAGNGDRDAFRLLLERHYDPVFRLALRLCGNREEAEDITQDVCEAMATRIGEFRGDSQFRTWLYRVVVNRAHDAGRRCSTQRRLQEAYGEVEALRRDEARQVRAEIDWLNDMMQRLPPLLRETAVLVVGEALNHAEAGEILGVSEGTVSWRMSELKKALRLLAREEA